MTSSKSDSSQLNEQSKVRLELVMRHLLTSLTSHETVPLNNTIKNKNKKFIVDPNTNSSSSFPHLFPLLCGVDVSYETPPFSTVLRVLP